MTEVFIFECYSSLAKSHDDVLVHQQARAGHETQQLAIDLALCRIFDPPIKHPREPRDQRPQKRREDSRSQLAPAAPKRVHPQPRAPCDPMQVVEAHHVPVAPVRDAILVSQRRAPSLVVAAQQVMYSRGDVQAIGRRDDGDAAGTHHARDFAEHVRDVRQMLDHLEHQHQVEARRPKRKIVVEVDRHPAGVAGAILGRDDAPSALRQQPARQPVARTQVQRRRRRLTDRRRRQRNRAANPFTHRNRRLCCTGVARSRCSRESGSTVLNWNHQPVKPYTLVLARESGGMADAQGSGPCERKLVGVQVPSLAPNLHERPASRRGHSRSGSIGRRDRVSRVLVARMLRSVALGDVSFTAADSRRNLGVRAARLLLQLHHVAIDVVGGHRTATRNSACQQQRPQRGRHHPICQSRQPLRFLLASRKSLIPKSQACARYYQPPRSYKL